jgi:hypothetical protein
MPATKPAKKFAIYITHHAGRTYYQSKLFGRVTCLSANVWTTDNFAEAREKAVLLKGHVQVVP